MKYKLITVLIATLFLVNMLSMVGSVSAQTTGDVDGNGTVDIRDGVIIGTHFGLTNASLNWDPRADIVPDNIINIQDIVLWATHF